MISGSWFRTAPDESSGEYREYSFRSKSLYDSHYKKHGKEFRSLEFADWLGRRLGAGRDLVFVIGGAYGFSEAVYTRADGRISLSKMTFSHQLVRTIFAEQLYRAFTILRSEPYHHE